MALKPHATTSRSVRLQCEQRIQISQEMATVLVAVGGKRIGGTAPPLFQPTTEPSARKATKHPASGGLPDQTYAASWPQEMAMTFDSPEGGATAEPQAVTVPFACKAKWFPFPVAMATTFARPACTLLLPPQLTTVPSRRNSKSASMLALMATTLGESGRHVGHAAQILAPSHYHSVARQSQRIDPADGNGGHVRQTGGRLHPSTRRQIGHTGRWLPARGTNDDPESASPKARQAGVPELTEKE